MKKTYFLIGLVLTLTVAAFGQQQSKSSSSKVSGRSSGDASATGNAAGSMLAAGTSLEAQLQTMVDVKKSRVGDEVILKTTKAIKQNGETVVPKGSKLIGRITEVKQKTKDNATSRIGMVFDRLQGRELDMPINASIVSVATAQVNAAAGDLFATDMSGSSSTSGNASAGRSSGGGGLLGGVGSTVGGVVNTTASTVGQVAGTATNAVGSTVGQTTGTLGRTVNGLHISQSASGSASSSSTISAHGKDVKIQKGATFNLRLNGSIQN